LGASIISAGLALVTFFSLNRGGVIQISLENLTGVFKSILLASFFSLLERLTKYLEDVKSEKT
jgi:hypothetical protein